MIDKIERYDKFILLGIWILAISIWLQPILSNPLPFGEFDTSTHYAISAYMAETKESMVFTPHFLYDYSLVSTDQVGRLWYPPAYHTLGAILGMFTGNKIISVFTFFVIASTLIMITVFYLIKTLYGPIPALLASFMLIWSPRDYLSYFWGQLPQQLAFAFIPIIMLCFYKYYETIKKGDAKSFFMYLSAALLGFQFLIHPQFFFQSISIIGLYYLIQSIRQKKLIIRKEMFYAVGLCILLIIIGAGSTLRYTINLGSSNVGEDAFGYDSISDYVSRIFGWYLPYEVLQGNVPQSFISYEQMFSLWTIPFLIAGLAYLLLKRRDKDLLIISWLIGYYIMIHLDIFGSDRVHRFYASEAHLFFTIIALGIWFLPNIIKGMTKLDKNTANVMKYALFAGSLILIVYYNAIPAFGQITDAYDNIARVNEDQYETALWIRDNIDENSDIRFTGTISIAKQFWLQAISYKYVVVGHRETDYDFQNDLSYLIIDYSDLSNLAQQSQSPQKEEYIQSMKSLNQYEISLFNNTKPVFMNSGGTMRVYRLK